MVMSLPKTLTSYGAAVSGNDANDGNGFSPAVLSPEIMMKESVAIDIAKTMNTSADTDQTSSDAALTTSGNLGEERSPILFSDTVPNSPLVSGQLNDGSVFILLCHVRVNSNIIHANARPRRGRLF